MISAETKKNIREYMMLSAWFKLHEVDTNISSEQMEKVLTKIGNLEKALVDARITQTQLFSLNARVERYLSTPVLELNWDQRKQMYELIFGKIDLKDPVDTTP